MHSEVFIVIYIYLSYYKCQYAVDHSIDWSKYL